MTNSAMRLADSTRPCRVPSRKKSSARGSVALGISARVFCLVGADVAACFANLALAFGLSCGFRLLRRRLFDFQLGDRDEQLFHPLMG